MHGVTQTLFCYYAEWQFCHLAKWRASMPTCLSPVCRLDLAESIRAPNRGGPRRNPFEAAMAEAERQEAQHGPPEELPFTATILCIGIAGTGKTATMNSLLDRPAPSNFAEGTKKVCHARTPSPTFYTVISSALSHEQAP